MGLLKIYNRTTHKEVKRTRKGMVRASSLLESVIAITVLAICILIAVRVYGGLLADSPSLQYHKALFKMQEHMAQTRIDLDYNEELFDYKTFKIIKSSSDYEGDPLLRHIKLQAVFGKDTLREDFLIKIPAP